MYQDMTEGKPIKHIVRFAVPILIGGIFQQMYNLADTAIVGKYLGNASLAAVGSTGALFFLLLSLIMGLTNGTGIVLAQYVGSKDYKGLQSVLNGMVIIIGSLTAVLSIIGVLFSDDLLRLLDTPDEIYDTAYSYIRIMVSFCFTMMLYNASSTVLRSFGNSMTPLYALMTASVINVGLDILFIKVFHMGVEGVAYATTISQSISAAINLTYIHRNRIQMHISYDFKIPPKNCLIKIIRAGLPASLQSSLISLGNMSVQRLINSFGTSVIAAVAATSKIDTFALTIVVGIATSLSVFTSHNIGAQKTDRITAGLHQTLLLMMGVCAVIALIVFTFKEKLLALFIDPVANPKSIEIGIVYLSIIGIAYIIAGIMQTYLNMIRGAGDVNTSFAAGIIELTSRVVFSYLLVVPLGTTGLWIAIPISWGMGCLVPVLRYKSGKWRRKSFIDAERV